MDCRSIVVGRLKMTILFLPSCVRNYLVSPHNVCDYGERNSTSGKTGNVLVTSALDDLSSTTEEIGCCGAMMEMVFIARS